MLGEKFFLSLVSILNVLRASSGVLLFSERWERIICWSFGEACSRTRREAWRFDKWPVSERIHFFR